MGLGREGNALGQRSGVLAEQLVQRLRIGFRVEFHLPFFDNLRGGQLPCSTWDSGLGRSNLKAGFLDARFDVKPVGQRMRLDYRDRPGNRICC